MLSFGQITTATVLLCGNWTEICFQFVHHLNCICACLFLCVIQSWGVERRNVLCCALYNFRGLTSLPVLLVSQVTLNQLDSFKSLKTVRRTVLCQPGHASYLRVGVVGGVKWLPCTKCRLSLLCIDREKFTESSSYLLQLFSASAKASLQLLEPSVMGPLSGVVLCLKHWVALRCSTCFMDTETLTVYTTSISFRQGGVTHIN